MDDNLVTEFTHVRSTLMNRRSFLMSSGLTYAKQSLPSNTVHLGVIGAGSRGTFVMSVFQKDPALRVGAICDVYEPHLERGLAAAAKAGSAAKGT